MYDRRVGQQTFSFGVSGKLYRNALVMYDHQTDSLWSQIWGEAILGKLKGTRLRAIPSFQTTWGTWKRLHAETRVLSKKKSPYAQDPRKSFAYKEDIHGDYYFTPATLGFEGPLVIDPNLDLLPLKERVLGLTLAGRAKAFPFSKLKEKPVVNDHLGETPILVVFAGGSSWYPFGMVFERRVGGKTLRFQTAAESKGEEIVLTDQETGSKWLAFKGVAVQGKLKGQKLRQLIASYAFWFAWHDYFPDTEVFKDAAQNR